MKEVLQLGPFDGQVKEEDDIETYEIKVEIHEVEEELGSESVVTSDKGLVLKEEMLEDVGPYKRSLELSSSKVGVDEALRDGSASLMLARKVRNEESDFKLLTDQLLNLSHDSKASQITRLARSNEDQDEVGLDEGFLTPEADRSCELSLVGKESPFRHSHYQLSPQPLPRCQLTPHTWENMTSTIQLVLKTCEALWRQLEEERLNREKLYSQLQEQRTVITTLTAELIQIQEHQELILKEIHRERAGSDSAYTPQALMTGSLGREDRQASSKWGPSLSDIIANRRHASDPSDSTHPSHTPIPLSRYRKSKSAEEQHFLSGSGFVNSSLIKSFENYHITD